MKPTYFTLALFVGLVLLRTDEASAQAIFQPPGSNLTYGDVTHGMRAQSASTNPAAAAADLARQEDNARSGTVVSGAFGLEYGNIQNLWDFYDQVAAAYKPSDPGANITAPGQLPALKPGNGIDLDGLWDLVDPDVQDELNAVVREVARQSAILALIATEGYGKAWVAADAPFVFANEYWGGAWTMQLHWSGTSKAYGIAQPIEFSEDTARAVIQDWIDTEVANRPPTLQVGGQVELVIDALGAVKFVLKNDSYIASKSSQLTSLSTGYSRAAWSNSAGALYLGGEAHLYTLQLSRFAVRFGDITDSEKLFDAIRNADFESDTRMGVDFGALWLGENYQLGAQVTNLNEPDFAFPGINIDAFTNTDIIDGIQRDRIYTMTRQTKLEASLFSEDRRWSWHLGVDANSARDPVGDEFQWMTAAAGYQMDGRWIPNIRVGFRQNLAGTEKTYASLGLTMFNVVNLDISSALDTTVINGTKLPEAVMASLGVQFSW